MFGDIIIKPVITEKSTKDANLGRFTFVVNTASSKPTISKAVEKTFAVHVVSIATSIVKGRRTRTGKRRTETSVSPWKKATVLLKQGEKIALFDTGGTKEV